MAVRTEESAVAEIAEVDETIDLGPFIEAASAVVDSVCAPLGYDAGRLELIERWLSAHFYHVRDPRSFQSTTGSVSDTFQTKIDLGFDVTHYGQQAMRIDFKGGLAELNNRTKVIGSKQTGNMTIGLNYLGRSNRRSGL